MEDKKNYEKQPAKTQELKTPKGKSATGKPLDGIIINPQQDVIAKSANEDFRGLTATSKAYQVAQRQSLARLAEKREITKSTPISELFVDLDKKETTGLIRVIENVINEYKALGDPMAVSLQKMLSDVLPRDMVTESLIKKSNRSGIPFSTLSEVFNRGADEWNDKTMTREQYAFTRVNSYVARGKAYELDADLREDAKINEELNDAFAQLIEKRGLWDNIHAKQERIKRGSGEHMRKPGSKGAPTAQDFKNSQTKESLKPKREHGGLDINEDGKQKQSKNPNDASSRLDATDSLVKIYKKDTPKAVKEDINESFQIAMAAGFGVTMTARDHGMRVQGAFELHPSVVEEMAEMEEEVRSADVRGEIVPGYKKTIQDKSTGQLKTLNIPAHLTKGKVRKKIIGSGDVHNGEESQ